jgi:hypothetical protein
MLPELPLVLLPLLMFPPEPEAPPPEAPLFMLVVSVAPPPVPPDIPAPVLSAGEPFMVVVSVVVLELVLLSLPQAASVAQSAKTGSILKKVFMFDNVLREC